jgi:hypothetical protein
LANVTIAKIKPADLSNKPKPANISSSLAIAALDGKTTGGAISAMGLRWEPTRRGEAVWLTVLSWRTNKQITHPLLAAVSGSVKAHTQAHRQYSTMEGNY